VPVTSTLNVRLSENLTARFGSVSAPCPTASGHKRTHTVTFQFNDGSTLYICLRAAPHTSAAAGAFSGSLIPEGKNDSATALRVAHGSRLRAWGQRASKSGNSGRFRGGRIVIESGESLPQTA